MHASPNYVPLPADRSIRLLTVHSAPNDALVSCSLEIVNLDDAPPYEAVSYCWGTAASSNGVRCDGKHVRLSASLELALRRLRKSDCSRRLWADQLCIDQTNLKERTKQVLIMLDIYRRAERVLVWLGEDEEGITVPAFKIIELAATLLQQETNGDFSSLRKIKHEDPHYDKMKELGFWEDKEAWKAVAALFSRPWFKRVWVVQEVSAGTPSTIFIGERSIDWIRIGMALDWFVYKGYMRMVGGLYLITDAMNIWTTSRTAHEGRVPLLHCLGLTASFEATNKRDKIFALLGLTIEGELRLPALEPEYERPTVVLYSDVVKHLIRHPQPGLNQKLGVLSSVYHFHELKKTGFPSWIPHWDQTKTGRTIVNSVGVGVFCASKDLDASMKFSDSFEILTLKGLMLDTIKTVDHNLRNIQSILQLWEGAAYLWRERALKLSTLYPDPESLALNFAAAVTAGGTNQENSVMNFSAADFRRYCQECCEAVASSQESAEFKRKYIDFPMPYATSEPRYEAEEFQSSILPEWPFFTTSDKGYMGLGHETIREGDKLCIFFGGVAPYIVRPRDDGDYELVGECYAAGLMEGHAIDAWRAGQLDDMWITLR